jgi:hypothetical protein
MAYRPVERAFTVLDEACAARQRPVAAPNKHLTAGHEVNTEMPGSGTPASPASERRWSGGRRRRRRSAAAGRARLATGRRARGRARGGAAQRGRGRRRGRITGGRARQESQGQEQSLDHGSPHGLAPDCRDGRLARSGAGAARLARALRCRPLAAAVRCCTRIARPLQVPGEWCLLAPPFASGEPVQERCYGPWPIDGGGRESASRRLLATAAPRVSDGDAGR